MSEPIRILVVDDHNIVRQGLVALLNTVPDLKVVAEASDGEEAITVHRQHRPDVTLMDLRLPKIGGADARPESPDKVLAFSESQMVDQVKIVGVAILGLSCL